MCFFGTEWMWDQVGQKLLSTAVGTALSLHEEEEVPNKEGVLTSHKHTAAICLSPIWGTVCLWRFW